ncbi:MAG TPA: class I SAM-dependent methyltransferase, partial [Polyangiaceae bacterium]|nr:class I SAM-dependent methyltransferase [Polyangiaceae bacterium]
MAFEPLVQPLRPGRVLAERDGLLVVDKPAGIPVHGGDEELAGDLVSRLARLLRARGGEGYIGVHQRLDEGTSGVLLFTTERARNAEVARAAAERSLARRYFAAVSLRSPRFAKRLAAGPVRLEHRLEIEGGRARVVEVGGVVAVANVALVERIGERALVELEPETGRTHQLRVQLAHEGAPIAGDDAYGGEPAARLMLHATKLELGGERFESPLPAGFVGWVRGEAPTLGAPETVALALEDAGVRRSPLAALTNAYRLVNELGDELPGITIDRYGDYAVLQVSTPEADRRSGELAERLIALGARGVYLKRRVRGDVRKAGPELTPETPIAGEPAPERFVVEEHGIKLWVELGRGLSTGLFVDQRENRRLLRDLAHDARVLNLFAYTSSFSVAAALGGARRVVSVDISKRPLEIARDNFRLNRLDPNVHAFEQADALAWAARAKSTQERFELVVLDPPSFASQAGGSAWNVEK